LGCREFSASEWELVEPAKAQPDASINDDFGVVFRDFNFSPVWNHWGHDEGKPLPADGWDQPGKRPDALRPLHAKAEQGWIRVSEIRDGKVVAVRSPS
jgi:CRISPR-associated protein Cas5d